MMLIKDEVEMAISVIKGIIALIESLDPNAAENPVVIQFDKVVKLLQEVGL